MDKRELFFKDLELHLLLAPHCFPPDPPNVLPMDRIYKVKRKIRFITDGGNSIELFPENEHDYVNFNSDIFLIISKNNTTYKIFWDKILGYVFEF